MRICDLNEATNVSKEPGVKGLGLSLTKMKTFAMCPHKYELQYINPVKVDKADFNPKYFKKGQLAHKEIESKIKGVSCDFKSTSLSDKEQEETKKSCETIFNNEYIKTLLPICKTEQPFSMYITSESEDGLVVTEKSSRSADFNGSVDFWAYEDNTIHIVDWKTGKLDKNDDDDAFMQVYIYAKACQKIKNIENCKFKLSYFYVEHDFLKTKELNSVEELNKKIIKIVEDAVHISKTSTYEAKPGPYCFFCPFGKPRKADNVIVCKTKAEIEELKNLAKPGR